MLLANPAGRPVDRAIRVGRSIWHGGTGPPSRHGTMRFQGKGIAQSMLHWFKAPITLDEEEDHVHDELGREVDEEEDELSKRIYESWSRYRDDVVAYHEISERAYINARAE